MSDGRARLQMDRSEKRHAQDPVHGHSVAIDYSVAFGYTSSVKEIVYSRTAQKALTRMPRNRAKRIRDKIRAYATDPASQANNVTRLKGQDRLLRLRVGDWRISMRDPGTLHILNVTSRGSAYEE